MQPIQKKKTRTIAFVLIASLSFLAVPRESKALWTPDIPAMIFKQALEEAYDAFQATMRASLKQMAAKLIKGRIEALLMGKKGKPMYIQNYETFIYASAQQKAQAKTTSFFDSVNSKASGDVQKMIRPGQQAAINEIFKGTQGFKPNLDEYVKGGSKNLFNQGSGGGLAAFNAAVSNPANMAAGNYYMGSWYATNELVIAQDANRTEAVAGRGYVSKKDPKTNMIKLPGSLLSDLTSYAESLPMQIMAVATSIPEIIGTMAAQMLTETIQNGISKVTQPLDNQLSNIHNQVAGGVKTVQDNIYKGVKFVGGMDSLNKKK